MAEIDALLDQMRSLNASDLHLKPGARPYYRMHGELEQYAGAAALSGADIHRMASEILTGEQRQRYRDNHEVDFGYGDIRRGRFRCTLFEEYNGPAAAFRRIPGEIPALAELNLPDTVEMFAHLSGGLVLVTGATGAGKTTTLAALIDIINTRYRKHIITLEDPIEYLHECKRSLLHQRELYRDVTDFAAGITAAMREAPDVLLIGELRDQESIRQALSAAELGILIFATLHTNGAAASCDRIIDVFPADEQPLVRAMLAQSLTGVVSQVLFKQLDKAGRIPATEILVSNPAISTLIRENKVHEIASQMQLGRQQGMHTLDDSLERLLERGEIDPSEAYGYATNKVRFERFVEKKPAGR